MGFWTERLKPQLKDMKPGDIRTVESIQDPRITVDKMQANVANVCTALFGSGNYITTRVKREDGWTGIQVLRA